MKLTSSYRITGLVLSILFNSISGYGHGLSCHLPSLLQTPLPPEISDLIFHKIYLDAALPCLKTIPPSSTSIKDQLLLTSEKESEILTQVSRSDEILKEVFERTFDLLGPHFESLIVLPDMHLNELICQFTGETFSRVNDSLKSHSNIDEALDMMIRKQALILKHLKNIILKNSQSNLPLNFPNSIQRLLQLSEDQLKQELEEKNQPQLDSAGEDSRG